MKKILAFTLAETLIVMGIIGVVAALTLPNLNSSTAEKEKIVKLQKIYQNLDDAYGRAQAVYGPIDEWFVNDGLDLKKSSTRFAQRVTEFMKISKDCGIGAGAGCFTQGNAKYFDGSGNVTSPSSLTGEYKVLLADGTSVNFGARSNGNAYMLMSLYVDIDGPNKGTYAWNRDLFSFDIDMTTTGEKTLKPYGSNWTDAELTSVCFTQTNAFYGACTAWVIQTGSMDYLKATKGKCPNGTVLSWSNTTCK